MLRAMFLLFVLAGAWGAEPLPVRAEARSIESFVTSKEKWGELVGTRWNLEGRYSGFSSSGLKFLNCDLPFVFVDPKGIQRPMSAVVEVTGRLEREENKLVFKVESFRSRPDDQETLRGKRAALDANVAAQWNALADWAQGRGTFYRDPKLLVEADQLRLQAIRIEQRNLPKGDAAALTALIDKARALPAAADLVRQLVHERLQGLARQLKTAGGPDDRIGDLLVTLRKEFPPSATPLTGEFPEELNGRYLSNPIETFRTASIEEQDVLARLFYLEMMSFRILRDARKDGSNGLEIADRLRVEVPEQESLAAAQERLGIDSQAAKVAQMTRSQLLAFADELKKRNQEERIPQVKRDWLLGREASQRSEGAPGLIQLGDAWVELLNDDEVATRFYLEAWKADPDHQPAHERLTVRGLVLYGDKWTAKDKMPANPKTRIELAVEEGRVEPGMTSEQVRKAFGALPTSTTRFASNGAITEIWIYEGAGVAVRFTRRNRPEPSRVVAVESLAGSRTSDPPATDAAPPKE